MKQQIIARGGGTPYDSSKDHISVKTTVDLTEGRVTVVEDTLKPGFDLARHYQKRMTEIFYILEGTFMEPGTPDTLHEGYATADDRWICKTCREDFKVMFGWKY